MNDKSLAETIKKLEDNLLFQDEISKNLDTYFKEKVLNVPDGALIDFLIEHVKKTDNDLKNYEAVKVLKAEILKRIKDNS